jgi:hypothetical protein
MRSGSARTLEKAVRLGKCNQPTAALREARRAAEADPTSTEPLRVMAALLAQQRAASVATEPASSDAAPKRRTRCTHRGCTNFAVGATEPCRPHGAAAEETPDPAGQQQEQQQQQQLFASEEAVSRFVVRTLREAEQHRRAGRYDRCRKLLDEILRHDPCCAAALSKRASCLANNDDLASMCAADADFTQAVKLGAGGLANPALCQHIGWSGLNGRMYRAAIRGQHPSMQKFEVKNWCDRDELRQKSGKGGVTRTAALLD